ncbi:MAG: biotin synthase BioB [Deltaproteobacteria bacterium]|nr:biotin synthase BioB [Deltaproteobacteria bacterium]
MTIIEQLKKISIKNKGLGEEEAWRLCEEGSINPFGLMAAASEIRDYFKGKAISFCGIVNAKSGRCSEDCAFCAQSAHYKTNIQAYPLKKADEIIAAAQRARTAGAEMFGIVTSGKGIKSKKEWAEIFRAIEGICSLGVLPCASLGIITGERARALKDAGLFRYHHNLETSRSYFRNICTTHEYDEDIETVRTAINAGLSVCSGGLVGLGEGMSHRIELALTLRELAVDSVPINILTPIKGTPLGGRPPLPPLEILITIALFRFLLPDRDIRLCGGKEKSLRQLLPLAVVAGSNAFMTGHYLTTPGRDPELDVEMIRDMGFMPTREPLHVCKCATDCHLEDRGIEKNTCS